MFVCMYTDMSIYTSFSDYYMGYFLKRYFLFGKNVKCFNSRNLFPLNEYSIKGKGMKIFI